MNILKQFFCFKYFGNDAGKCLLSPPLNVQTFILMMTMTAFTPNMTIISKLWQHLQKINLNNQNMEIKQLTRDKILTW